MNNIGFYSWLVFHGLFVKQMATDAACMVDLFVSIVTHIDVLLCCQGSE